MDEKKKMNMLFLFTDQQRTDTLSCYGNEDVSTPSIDRLAKSGTKFTHAYTPNAVCTPARASLLTGVMPHTHQILTNFDHNTGYPEEISNDQTAFSKHLVNEGYRVGLEGKWHVSEKQSPSYFGFEGEHYPSWENPINHLEYLAYLKEHNLKLGNLSKIIRGTLPNGKPTNGIAGQYDGPLEATFEYFLAHKTITRLREYASGYRNGGQPFYLACHWFGPHLPYNVPEHYYNYYDPNTVKLPESFSESFLNKPKVQEMYSRYWAFDSFSLDEWKKLIAIYRGYVKMIDDLTGMILDELENLGLEESTAVFFSSDHGEFTGAHKMNSKGPAMYEDIYNIPLIIRIPGAPGNVVDKHLVSLIDVTATFLDLAGLYAPTSYEGDSLAPLVEGQNVPDWRKEIVCEFHGLHFPHPLRMIRNERYKLIVNPADISELYDLKKDPFELVNEIDNAEYKKVKKELASKLYCKLKKSNDAFYFWMGANFEIDENILNESK
ncbi:sulfatase-like hydrolase/transferase [Lentibacillus sp. N15]|uniref:sulfatase-like hydrolase/transferase n=1 Tax=Lentibacillus songyuanensis TaxID=3136161 RepID=UPI0031B9B27F